MKRINQEIESELLEHARRISRLVDSATTQNMKIRLIKLAFEVLDVMNAGKIKMNRGNGKIASRRRVGVPPVRVRLPADRTISVQSERIAPAE